MLRKTTCIAQRGRPSSASAEGGKLMLLLTQSPMEHLHVALDESGAPDPKHPGQGEAGK